MTDPADKLEERIQELKAGLVAITRGDHSDLSEADYKETRRLILSIPQLRDGSPPWLRTASTLTEVNKIIRQEADRRPGGKWANRADLVFKGLNPLLQQLDDEQAKFEAAGELGERLGGGGFGEVYRWKHRALDIDFAVKVLKPSFPLEDGRYIERFFREARILLKLNHPNVVRVYDVGMYGRRPFIKMELLEGRNMDELLKTSGPLEPKHAALTIAQLAGGIAHAHRQNIVHRDLKPTNIFCTTDDRVCVIDFGLGAFVEGELISRLTRVGEAVAGGLYTAPELVADPALLDVRTDIYSAGAVWFTALTGRPPAGASVHEQIDGIPGLTRDYRQVMKRALADHASRYGTADEFAAAITALVDAPTPGTTASNHRGGEEPPPGQNANSLAPIESRASGLAAKIVVTEGRQTQHLVLSLQLRAAEPIPHLQPRVTGLSRWIEELSEFAPVLAFKRAVEAWQISRTGGEDLLHFDHPGEYQICALGSPAASIQFVTGNGRGGYPLRPFGTYRLEVVFQSAGVSITHTSYIRSQEGAAEFTSDPRVPARS